MSQCMISRSVISCGYACAIISLGESQASQVCVSDSVQMLSCTYSSGLDDIVSKS